jgi:hypothetical protein
VKSLSYVSRDIVEIWCRGFILKSYDKLATIAIIEREDPLDYLGFSLGTIWVDPTLDLAIEVLIGMLDKFVELLLSIATDPRGLGANVSSGVASE